MLETFWKLQHRKQQQQQTQTQPLITVVLLHLGVKQKEQKQENQDIEVSEINLRKACEISSMQKCSSFNTAEIISTFDFFSCQPALFTLI